MIFKSVNGAFCSIVVMGMWWNQLVAAIIICDGLSKGATRFVVHDVGGGHLMRSMKPGM